MKSLLGSTHTLKPLKHFDVIQSVHIACLSSKRPIRSNAIKSHNILAPRGPSKSRSSGNDFHISVDPLTNNQPICFEFRVGRRRKSANQIQLEPKIRHQTLSIQQKARANVAKSFQFQTNQQKHPRQSEWVFFRKCDST